jgi:hypothetical protein
VGNVVQVIIDNGSNYVSASNILEEKHQTTFGSYVLHTAQTSYLRIYANLIGKEGFRESQKNYQIHLQLQMGLEHYEQKHMCGELARPTITRFATSFPTLQYFIAR